MPTVSRPSTSSWVSPGLLILALAGCGGGGDGDSASSINPDLGDQGRWREQVADITNFGPAPGSVTAMGVRDMPRGRAGMSGGFGARLGGTSEAVIGAAHMVADFDAARVQGWVDQAGIHEISQSTSLQASTPQLTESLAGRLVIDGSIKTTPPVGEGPWYDAGITGSLTGAQTAIDVAGRTDRGAFFGTAGNISALGTVTGSAIVRDNSGSQTQILREGVMYVEQN